VIRGHGFEEGRFQTSGSHVTISNNDYVSSYDTGRERWNKKLYIKHKSVILHYFFVEKLWVKCISHKVKRCNSISLTTGLELNKVKAKLERGSYYMIAPMLPLYPPFHLCFHVSIL
jgi:hypothetical protein